LGISTEGPTETFEFLLKLYNNKTQQNDNNNNNNNNRQFAQSLPFCLYFECNLSNICWL